MAMRNKQVKTTKVIVEFLRANGDCEKAAAAIGNPGINAEKVRGKMKDRLSHYKKVLLGGTPIPKGEEGYEEGKNNLYSVEPQEVVDLATKLVKKLEQFPILTEDKRGRKGSNPADLLKELADFLD